MIKRAVAILLLAALLIGVIAYSRLRPESSTVSGFIEADETRLGSRVGGHVAEVLVEEGQRVRQGQILVELEPYDLLKQEQEAAATLKARQADLQRLEAGLRDEEVAQAAARHRQLVAHLEKLKNGPRPQEKVAAEANLRAAESELKLAEQNHERVVSLAARNAAPQEDLDRASEELQAALARRVVREQELALLKEGTRREEIAQAEAQVEEARQTLLLAEDGFRDEEIEAARAARDAAQAALEALRLRIAELKITASSDGVVQAIDLHPGDLVPPNAPVLSVLDDRRLWVRAYVPEDRLDLQLGRRLTITVDSYPDEEFEGEVTFISDQAEFTPSNVQTRDERVKQVFRIKVALTQDQDRLRPGMAAVVQLKPREP